MQKLLIISFFSILSFACFSQPKNDFLLNKDINIYDLIYLNSHIEDEQNVLLDINEKINFYQNKVIITKNTLNSLQYKLDLYSNIYADLLVHFYLVSLNLKSTSVFVFSSNTFNQIFQRYNYIILLVRYIHDVNDYLKLTQTRLDNELLSFKSYTKSLDLFLSSYQEKKVKLDSQIALSISSANLMQQNADEIRTIINNGYAEFAVLDKFLNNTSLDTIEDSSSFINLSLPLKDGVVISSFGVHSHPYLKNITVMNDGIDIFSKTDTLVKAVFLGEVVSIVKIPNFGTSVILKHEDYYSVYSNLNKIYIDSGQKLYKNQIIGSISPKTSKYSFPCLNLQIWHNTEKLNPKNYLIF